MRSSAEIQMLTKVIRISIAVVSVYSNADEGHSHEHCGACTQSGSAVFGSFRPVSGCTSHWPVSAGKMRLSQVTRVPLILIRDRQERPGAPRSAQESPGAPRSAQERPGEPRRIEKSLMIPRPSNGRRMVVASSACVTFEARNSTSLKCWPW